MVELLVVLAIVAIVAGIVSPYARGSFKGRQLQDAAMTLATHIRYAQALAVDRGRPSRLHVDLERQRYRVELARDFNGYDFAAAPGRAGQYTSLPARVEFGTIELSNGMSSSDVLLFAPSDQWTVGQIVLTNGEASATVKVKRGLGCVNAVREITGRASSAD